MELEKRCLQGCTQEEYEKHRNELGLPPIYDTSPTVSGEIIGLLAHDIWLPITAEDIKTLADSEADWIPKGFILVGVISGPAGDAVAVLRKVDDVADAAGTAIDAGKTINRTEDVASGAGKVDDVIPPSKAGTSSGGSEAVRFNRVVYSFCLK